MERRFHEITLDEGTKHPVSGEAQDIWSRAGLRQGHSKGIMMSFYERLVKSKGIKPRFAMSARVRSFRSMKRIKRTTVKGPTRSGRTSRRNIEKSVTIGRLFVPE